jgi:hypothetical protein
MTPRTGILGLVTAVAAVAALAGCGSSGPSKAEFVKKADELCAATNRAHPPKPQPRNAKEAAAQQAEEIQIRVELDKELKGLEVPDSEKSAFGAYNAGTQQIIAALRRMQVDANAKNQKKFGLDAQALTKAQIDRERSAIKLGFKTCGRKNPVQ